MILNGTNLGERHRDFNSKVSEAVARQTNFEELKSQPEECDIDKLFKIDIASKYKNIDYILEVLKCGDVFYISRALKCSWMYNDEYSQFINPEYLEANIFPKMSIRMKRKMITAISVHVKNSDRVIVFYNYCIDTRLNDYANKFIFFASDSFKLNLIRNRNIRGFRNLKLLQLFIGSSFELAKAYVQENYYSSWVILQLSYLYSVSEGKYLDILGKIQTYARNPHFPQRLGIRTSKSILKKHKQRVLNDPLLYINILHRGMLVKHITTEDVETLAPGLLPDSSRYYWSLNFYNTYKFILEKIPANKIYGYLKQIYVSKYDKDEFEMKMDFYWLNYYEMLNMDEREEWALKHIERNDEYSGVKTYIWYKFVSFRKAFAGIKRYIFLTPDKDERSRIVNVLPETARNQNDLIEILNYYYKRHVNECEGHKESFINKIIELHDIYSFNDECWTAFDNLLHSLDVYRTDCYIKMDYKFRSYLYHIFKGKEIPGKLEEFFEPFIHFHHFESVIKMLSEEQKATVAKYLLSKCGEKIESLMCHPDFDKESENDEWNENSIKNKIQNLVAKIWSIIYFFERPHEECPAVAVQYMDFNKDFYEGHEMYKVKFEKKSEEDFVRWLKQDIDKAVNGIPEIRCNTYRWNFRLCRLFRKLKVYFSNDVAKEYLNYFMGYLSDVPKGRREYRNIKMAVVGVFYLADQESIICFLEKNVPTSPKIDHMNIDNRVLQVQKAICRLSYHPRPPLPLSVIQKYIAGDYVHYSFPVIYNYFSSLPSSTKFIEHLLDTPLSIQKHGLRLAFRSYVAETLTPIIKSAWQRTRNVSLRMVLYEILFNRIIKEKEEEQEKLYEVLKMYTSELNHYDHDDVYSLLVSDYLPDTFKGDFIETAWITVSKLTDKSVDIHRRINVIRHMEKYIHLVQRDFPRLQIIDDHVKDMLFNKNINRDCDKDYLQELIEAKWELTAKYIVSFRGEVEQQQSLQLLQMILNETFQSWNLVKDESYTLRIFIDEFIKTIMDKDPKTIESCESIVVIYQCILDSIRTFLKREEIYLLNWKLKLAIMSRNVIHEVIQSNGGTNGIDIANAFGTVVAKIVKHSVRNNEFYHYFYESMADIINKTKCKICDILGIGYDGFIYYVCETLIKTRITETHVLALLMLPKDPEYYFDCEHESVISGIITKCVSQEVQCYFSQKFVLSDYVVRY